ncbi:hypothetical protein Ade02nite_87520 [Paractinoplanes deccanensis]|uniref:Anti-sigma factor antagonist n=1 Tax=Paractinoplanes deccanensis TaxID=113561 RepID=A0ABQ3YJD5_9ACTN|nr:STAS domain-containing protein [Actinoplanes deccanensis]GID80111.1 hypothetical protein Ade02nite_87520 [Actinoplanes deccanensis]
MIVSTCGTSAGTIHLAAAGEVDLGTVDDLTMALARAISTEGAVAIVIDFSEVTFCDSSGLHALDRAYHEAHVRGLVFRLTNPQHNVRRLLEVTGLAEQLTGS